MPLTVKLLTHNDKGAADRGEYRQAAGATPQRLKRRVRRLSRRQVDRILELVPAGFARPHITDTTLGQML